jgi:hypothetical protein
LRGKVSLADHRNDAATNLYHPAKLWSYTVFIGISLHIADGFGGNKMAQQGYFVISDITGYTAFLTGSELDHAQDILKTLFHVLIDNFKSPLTISNYQGDAILSYAPSTSFLQGQTLLEAVENLYFAFAQTRERIQRNTSCTCQACRNIPNLDLKLFVHHGDYVLTDLRGKQELSGTDVIIVHRMMKNEVKEKTGVRAYTLFSEASLKALGLDEFAEGLTEHSEEYDHIGEVKMRVHDLKPAWEQERDRRRDVVTPEETWLTYEIDIPAPPALVWDYLAEPMRRREYLEVRGLTISGKKHGRQGIGSVNHCAHGENEVTDLTVTDWRPFDYKTELMTGMPFGISIRATYRLTPIAKGTHLTILLSHLVANSIAAKAALVAIKPTFKQMFDHSFNRQDAFQQLINKDVQAGRIQLSFAPA